MRTLRNYAALTCALALVFASALPFRARATTTTEGFESGSKTAYAAADVSLSTGWWYFDDALIGNLSTDRKTGAASARIRNTGSIKTDFDFSSAGTVTIQHAVFGTDGSSTWELWDSTNGGTSYTKVGSTITTSSTSLQTATFNVNSSVAVRLSIRKTGGGANRINIDNVTVNSFSQQPPPTGEHLTMGNPSNAVVDVNQPNNYLLDKPQYAVSYNRDNGRPNWVSWHLDSTWLGS
ncbi:MAG TPA: DNA/RNA non-specific endonuclease, partial [Pyrinomonadaceae bacterium]|nr:DNA/RNA non-specific endonuclease [Pyrinomonadaceae bacterium]